MKIKNQYLDLIIVHVFFSLTKIDNNRGWREKEV